MADSSNVRRISLSDSRLQIIQSALGSDPIDVSVVRHLLSEQSRLMQAQADRLGRLLEEVHGLSGQVAEGIGILAALEAVVAEARNATGGGHES